MKSKIKFYKPLKKLNLDIFLGDSISAGFPSPAEDFKDARISLDEELVKNKESTFYAKVDGDSMIEAGISHGDILVIDRSIELANNKIGICFIDGEFTVKRIIKKGEDLFLKPENKNYKEIKVSEENNLIVWGVVTYVIKSL